MHSLCVKTYGIALRLQDTAAVETLGETFDAVVKMNWIHRPNTHWEIEGYCNINISSGTSDYMKDWNQIFLMCKKPHQNIPHAFSHLDLVVCADLNKHFYSVFVCLEVKYLDCDGATTFFSYSIFSVIRFNFNAFTITSIHPFWLCTGTILIRFTTSGAVFLFVHS